MKNNITPELVRLALGYIPPNLPRDEWARVAMAIKSEYPDTAGLELFDQWSQQAGDTYNAKATRDTWRSVKAGGRVGIGTLFHLAKAGGFILPKDDKPPAKPDPEARARIDRERAQARRQEQARTDATQARAADEAVQEWQGASEAGEALPAPYLTRKGLDAQPGRYGLRSTPAGVLLVPLRDAAGRLWNLQRIAPTRPADGSTDKLFVKGGRKSGLWHLLGRLPDELAAPSGGGHTTDTDTDTSASTSTDNAPALVLLLAEGLATAASLHEATGRPVAVAFDAGNLAHVAKALHQAHPAVLLVLAGDDDQATEARTGRNTGREKAQAAALAVGGLAVFPAGLPEGASDFNDLHQAAGLAAVREQVEAAIQAATTARQTVRTPAQPPALAPNPAEAGHATNASTAPGRRAAGAGGGGNGAPDDQDPSDYGRDPFTVSGSGVWHQGRDQEGKRKPAEWVCSRLDVEALTRDQDGGGWGYLLTFADPLGKVKQWAMPSRMLAGDGGEYRAALLNMGLRIAPAPRARGLLTTYIQTRQPAAFATCTDRIGWHGRAFVLPRETIGDDAERIVFQSESQIENTFTQRGTPEQWRDRVAALCVGNSRLAFAVACAFAGPLLRPAGVESGGFHLRGDSSSGKTTALKVAASVYGGASYLQRWRTTDNALEAIAAQHCDGLLILDELAQVDPKTAGECAYMLANEQSKARATRTGSPRARLAWRLLFLSAGELGLADHMAEGQKRARTGQEIRMADIPADAGAGLGAFEDLHGLEGGAAFARHVTGQAASVYGAAGRAWQEWLCLHADTLKATTRHQAEALAAQWVPEAASGQVERVGARFALVGAAGELATAAGLTGWPEGESERAARACFNAWLAARGGIGNGEVVAMLRAVRRFLEAHGEGRFTWWHRAADDHNAKTLQRAGFRRMVGEDGKPIKSDSDHQREYGERMPAMLAESVSVEYFVFAEVFKAEVCQGFDHQTVCRVLAEHECLTAKERGRYSSRERLPGIGLVRCYRIPSAIFDLDL